MARSTETFKALGEIGEYVYTLAIAGKLSVEEAKTFYLLLENVGKAVILDLSKV